MPAERYYASHELEQNAVIKLEDQEFHHLIHVMRNKLGNLVELINGKGVLAEAKIIEVHKNYALLAVHSRKIFKETIPHLILAQAIPRLNRLDYILEKGTELGVTEFRLFPSERSEKKFFTESQLKRMQTIVIGAMKQSGSAFLPTITFYEDLQKAFSPQSLAFFGDLNPNAHAIIDQIKFIEIAEEILLYIGPESGFTEKEVDSLQHLNIKGVKLHSNILRTDTAPIVAISQIYGLLLKKNFST